MGRSVVFATLVSLSAIVSSAMAEDSDFHPLFDGKSLQGWSPVNSSEGNWLVQEGLLVTKGKGGGWLSTDKTYKNFVLKLEFRLEKGGNSGVFIRAPHQGDPAYTGMELQVLDDDAPQYKELKPFQYTGSVYGVVAAKRGHTKTPGEWNQMEIEAKGSKVVVTLNGTKIVDTDLSEHTSAAKEHPGILRKDGHVGLQSHSDPVQFRNISIKELN